MTAWLRTAALSILVTLAFAGATQERVHVPEEPGITLGETPEDHDRPDTIGGLNNADESVAPRTRLRLLQLRYPGENRADESSVLGGGLVDWNPLDNRDVGSFAVRVHPDAGDMVRQLPLRSGAYSSYSTSLPPPALG